MEATGFRRDEGVRMASLRYRVLGSGFGCEVEGVRLGPDLAMAQVEELRDLIAVHRVLFVADQHHLGDDALAGLASRFGPLLPGHPVLPCDPPEVLRYVLPGHASRGEWRQDLSFLDTPPVLSLRRVVTAPERRGASVWADTAGAHQDLPAPLQVLCGALWARHRAAPEMFGALATPGAPAWETHHPVVRVHPLTQEKCLVLGDFVDGFVGLEARESAQVAALLQARLTRHQHVIARPWQAGEVVISDNVATLNSVQADLGSEELELARVVVGAWDLSPEPTFRPAVGSGGEVVPLAHRSSELAGRRLGSTRGPRRTRQATR